MKIAFRCMLAAVAALGAGCFSNDFHQAYPGAPLLPEETCTLRVPAMLDVRAIDGVATDWSLRVKKGPMQELSLLSGAHQLLVRYYDPTADESRQEIYEVDRIAVAFQANPKSVHELQYETWTRNAEMRRAKQKVRVWVTQIDPGQPVPAPRAAVSAPVSTGAPAAGQPMARGARGETLQSAWNGLTPGERETFLKWLLAQPQR